MARKNSSRVINYQLIFIYFSLLLFGLIMVSSTSMAIAERSFNDPFYYFNRQLIALLIGILISIFMLLIPISLLEKMSKQILILSLFLLMVILIPGVGKEVNGSVRWLSLGFFNLQVSEIMKLGFIIYLAGYITRKKDAIQNDLQGFITPMVILLLCGSLLLMQPDLGASLVIAFTVVGMLFIAGVPLLTIVIIGVALLILGALLIVFEPYRFIRLVSFTDPWQDPLNSGFQLTQSLMAYGRGDWFGVGLGNSLQKQFYLPEAHTDFIFSIIAEEFGVLGVLLTILLFFLLVMQLLNMAKKCLQKKKLFEAYLLCGFAIWTGIQAFINIGVSMGALPTKGLTLPFISYGGSSLMIMCLMMAIVLRIHYENSTSKPLNVFHLFNWKKSRA